jgi:6-phosphofructokinase 1
MVDISSTRYAIARRYMIRLRRDDLEDPKEVSLLAKTAHLSEDEFRQQFQYLVAHEPPPLAVDAHGERLAASKG